MRIDFTDDCDGYSFANVVGNMAGVQVVLRMRTLKKGQQHTYNYSDVDGVIHTVDAVEGVTLTHTDSDGGTLHLPSGHPVRTVFGWNVIDKLTYQ